jgi:hypothetical protein
MNNLQYTRRQSASGLVFAEVLTWRIYFLQLPDA